jgi:hypothetical protein
MDSSALPTLYPDQTSCTSTNLYMEPTDSTLTILTPQNYGYFHTVFRDNTYLAWE